MRCPSPAPEVPASEIFSRTEKNTQFRSVHQKSLCHDTRLVLDSKIPPPPARPNKVPSPYVYSSAPTLFLSKNATRWLPDQHLTRTNYLSSLCRISHSPSTEYRISLLPLSNIAYPSVEYRIAILSSFSCNSPFLLPHKTNRHIALSLRRNKLISSATTNVIVIPIVRTRRRTSPTKRKAKKPSCQQECGRLKHWSEREDV